MDQKRGKDTIGIRKELAMGKLEKYLDGTVALPMTVVAQLGLGLANVYFISIDEETEKAILKRVYSAELETPPDEVEVSLSDLLLALGN